MPKIHLTAYSLLMIAQIEVLYNLLAVMFSAMQLYPRNFFPNRGPGDNNHARNAENLDLFKDLSKCVAVTLHVINNET